MNKIKVWIQYPWRFPDSPYYKNLIENPPNDIEFMNTSEKEGAITDYKKFKFVITLKSFIRRWLGKIKISIPNAHLTKTNEKFDLIHCAHCLSKNKDIPWVADFEESWQFYIGKKRENSKRKVEEIFSRENCKKILPWTIETKKGILESFPNIENKIEVIYPAVPSQKRNGKKKKKITLVFVGRYFYRKGGLHTLEVFNRITKKYQNTECFFISQTPQEIKERYSKNNKIIFLELMPQKKLFDEVYSNADILVYPGYSDTFGFMFLEAMSFGIPIVTVDGFARSEIITDKKTGFIIPREKGLNTEMLGEKENLIVRNIEDRVAKLIENKKLREKMSKNCLEEIKNGKFSIKERNKKLRKIYEEALK